jgi:hypothetical protein
MALKELAYTLTGYFTGYMFVLTAFTHDPGIILIPVFFVPSFLVAGSIYVGARVFKFNAGKTCWLSFIIGVVLGFLTILILYGIVASTD